MGDIAQSVRGLLLLSYPVTHGIITDYDAMRELWRDSIYNAARVDPREHPFFLTEPIQNPCRRKTTEIWFEEFDVPALYFATAAKMSLFAEHITTGVAVELGGGLLQIVPVYQGHVIQHAVKRFNLGGHNLIEYFIRLLKESGTTLTTSAHFEIARDMLEKNGFVAQHFAEELEKSASSEQVDKSYELPDGQVITMRSERFRAIEPLFQPSLLGMEEMGIHELVHQAVMRCDIDVRRELFGKIVVTGGCSMFPGIQSRLQAEVQSLVPASVAVKVHETTLGARGRHFASWVREARPKQRESHSFIIV